MIKRLLLAFQFLTVVPLRVRGDVTEKEIAGSVAFFPFVGAFQGIVTAAASLVLARFLPAEVAAGFAILCLILTNHGFDLDGLADTFDALAIKSSGDPEKDRVKRLLVMKDSATGAAGVIAIVMVILLKFLLMKTIISNLSDPVAGTLFFLMPVFSKWITVPAMYHGVSARSDGLGKIFIDGTGAKDVMVATGLVVLLLVLAAVIYVPGTSFIGAVAFYALFCVGAYLTSLLAVRFLKRKFGGLTGDHFGAMTEATEVVFLLAAAIWLVGQGTS